jgi:hypothetical protein
MTSPREKLAFDDVTEDLHRLHRLPIEVKSNGAGVDLASAAPELNQDIDFDAICTLLESTGAAHGRDASPWALVATRFKGLKR